jgi:hypothetical protein
MKDAQFNGMEFVYTYGGNMEFINKEHKEKAKKLFKISPLLITGAIFMILALKFRVELGTDYTTVAYLLGGIILSTGLSILDHKVNGEIVYGLESKS